MVTPLLGLTLLAGTVALVWTGLALRFLAHLPSFQHLPPASGPKPAHPIPVDAVIAAHNEERTVAMTVQALHDQDHPCLSITVVDDQSTDATGRILEGLAAADKAGPPLHVVRGKERPDGWVGKTWALHQGVEQTRADWLLFVDADMRLHPSALAAAWLEARRTGADLVSLLPRPECTTFWQGAIAVTVLQLLAHVYPLDRVNDPGRAEALAAGGFILVRRRAYDQAGGHVRIRREILDDIQLATRVKESGGRLAVRAAPGLASTPMYGSFGAVWRGLRKNAYAGLKYRFYKYAVGSVLALAMAWAPPLALGCALARAVAEDRLSGGTAAAAAVGLAGWLAQAAAAAPFVAYLRLSPPFAFSLPAGVTAYVGIASAGVWHHLRGRIVWKDRVFPARVATTRVPFDPARRAPRAVPSAETWSKAA
jgi:glycosyltransferase involved in cell wall biosynthesis